jgi:hypothetical protein
LAPEFSLFLRFESARAAANCIQAAALAGASVLSKDTAANGTTTAKNYSALSVASSSQNFFSDYTASGGSNSCVSAARPASNLNEIFKEIGQSLTVARLIPNNAT